MARIFSTAFALLVLLALLPSKSFAQSTNDPKTLMTWSDGAKCDPTTGNNIDSVGCCGSPGLRECDYVVNWLKGGLSDPSPGCVNPDSNQLRVDPFESIRVSRCNFPQPKDSQILPALAFPFFTGNSFTFYFTSDIHFTRSTFDLGTQADFPFEMNLFAGLKPNWPGNTGIPSGDKIAAPVAVVIGGDLTFGGGIDQLGDFRSVWEIGNNPSAISFPIMPGLGNHDIENAGTGGAGAPSSAQRMWSYIGDAMVAVNMDRSSVGAYGADDGQGTHNYSWDWEGVHFVQLNCWAGFSNNLYSIQSDGLTWLRNDLAQNVGSSNRPVVVVQHFDIASVGDTRGDLEADARRKNLVWQQWWTIDDYLNFLGVLKGYNVVALFDGHEHKMQISRPEHYLDTLFQQNGNAVNGLPSPQDAFGNPQILDEFKNGTGGQCQAYALPNSQGACTVAKATFFAARVETNYLDVAAVVMNTGRDFFPVLGDSYDSANPDFTQRTPGFWGGTAACRKRINSQYVNVNAQTRWSASAPVNGSCGVSSASNAMGTSLTTQNSCITVKNTSNFTLPGPVAIQVANGSEAAGSGLGTLDNLQTRSFVDSCDEWHGNAYITVSDGDMAPGAAVSVPIQFEKGPETVQFQAFELASMGSRPITLDQTLITNTSSSPQPQTVHLLAPGANSYQTQTAYIGGPGNWLTVRAGALDATGAATLTLSYNANLLSASVGAFEANVTVISDTGGAAGLAFLTVKMVLSGTIVPTPAAVSFSANTAQVQLTAQGGNNIEFIAVPGLGFDVSPSRGTTPAVLTLTPNLTNVAAGTYTKDLNISWGTNSRINVPVSFSVEQATVSTLPSGQLFSVDGSQFQTPQTFTWISGLSHSIKVPQFIPTGAGSELLFSNWSDGGAADHSITSPAVGHPERYIAQFGQYYQLNLASDHRGVGGILTASPVAPQPNNYYAANTPVVITATPPANSFFSTFSGDLGGLVNPQSLSIGKVSNVTALFEPNSAAGQTVVQTNPSNQQVLVDSVPYQTPQIFRWPPSETHTLSVPVYATSNNSRFAFNNWSDGVQGLTRQVNGLASGQQKFTANLTQQYLVTTTTVPNNAATVAGGGWFNQNAPTTIAATPVTGFAFTSFSGSVQQTTNPILLNVSQPLNIQANLSPVRQPQVYAVAGQRSSVDPLQPDLQKVVITLTNAGPGPAGDALITGIDGFTALSGTGTVSLFGLSPFPANVGTLLAGQSASSSVLLAWPAGVTRLQLTVHFAANGTSYSASTKLNIFR